MGGESTLSLGGRDHVAMCCAAILKLILGISVKTRKEAQIGLFLSQVVFFTQEKGQQGLWPEPPSRCVCLSDECGMSRMGKKHFFGYLRLVGRPLTGFREKFTEPCAKRGPSAELGLNALPSREDRSTTHEIIIVRRFQVYWNNSD